MPTPQRDNPDDRTLQFSLRQLWGVVSVCGVLFAVPFCALLLLWLSIQLGLAAFVLIALILLQAPVFFLFRSFRLLRSRRREITETQAVEKP